MADRRMMDLKRRFFMSTVVGSAVVLLIAFSTYPFVSWLLLAFVAALAGIGVWEYGQLAQVKGLKTYTSWMVAFAIAEVVALYTSLAFVELPQLPIFVIALALVSFFLLHFKETSNSLCTIAVEFFGIAYIAIPLGWMLGVLYPVAHLGVPQEGRLWLLYLIAVTKVTDVAAYFIGRLWGRRKLSPTLSPKKTIEGAIAGFLSAIAMSLLFHLFATHSGHFTLSLVESIWLGGLIGICGQVGDLAESLLKRDAEVKDSNRLPGFGGVLDMVDSLLFTTPIVHFFIRMH